MSEESDSSKKWSKELSASLGDKLIDKRERLGYWTVTACTAVVVFTLNNLNHPQGLLRQSGEPVLIAYGCLFLIYAAGGSLYLIWERHRQYSRYLQMEDALLENRAEDVARLDSALTKYQGRMSDVQLLVWMIFSLGMLTLVFAYTLSLQGLSDG